jgi:putative acetyltransferase
MSLIIRNETPGDAAAIAEVTAAAFRDHPYSDGSEPAIVAGLRAAGALTLSLVAVIDGQPVGHVAFSPVELSDGTTGWYGLGPVSVRPDRQRQGIGTALIEQGLSRLRALRARGCVLVGPPGYYRRFGFRHEDHLTHDGVPPEVVLALAFDGCVPAAEAHFHPAFEAPPERPPGSGSD